jgi:hypothetical protein
MDSIKPETNIISILEIQGIKFTSRYFQIEIELKQSMAVSPDPFLDECFIKKPMNRISDQVSRISDQLPRTSDQLPRTLSNSTNTNANTNTNAKIEPIKRYEENSENSENSSNLIEMDSDLNIEFKEDLEQELKQLEQEQLEESIQIDVEDLNTYDTKDNDINELTEFSLNNNNIDTTEPITLKKPNQVYYEIYRTAREKAKLAKKEAILAFLEAKNIKTTYMLEDMIDSDSDMDDNEFDSLQ